MIDVVTTSFHIKASGFDKEDFERYSTALFDQWDKHVAESLGLNDYALTLLVEEGSIKGKGKIAASLAVVYFAIGAYGDFISGLRTIQGQATYVTSALLEQAKTTFNCTNATGRTGKKGGAISFLQNLFDRVQSGKLTSEEAIYKVRARFGDDAASVPGFLEDLESSLAQAPRHPEQLTLVDSTWVNCPEVDLQEPESPPKSPRPLPAPIPQHYRIEISRGSKNDKKKVKVTKVR